MANELSGEDIERVKKCFYRTKVWGGKTEIDGAEITSEEDAAFWFGVASGASTIGLMRTRAMIEVYKRAANENRPKIVRIRIKTPPHGTIEVERLDDESIAQKPAVEPVA